MDAELQEVVDYIAVTRLQNAYADTVTRRAWPELHDLFLPDAPVTINTRTREPFTLVGPQAIGDFISDAISVFEFFEFVILNRTISFDKTDPGTAGSRLNFVELRQDQASGRWTYAYCIYEDRYAKRDGRWWFAARQHHSLARTAKDFDVFPMPATERH